jgi:FkbM family methyltransferase
MLGFLRRHLSKAEAQPIEPQKAEDRVADAPEIGLGLPAQLTPEQVTFSAMSTDRALYRIRERGMNIGTVIDVGASNGMWSEVCEKHFPDARYFLVEAQRAHEAALNTYSATRPHVEYVISAAGDSLGVIKFNDDDLFGGVATHTSADWAKTTVPMTTIDFETQNRNLPGPYLIKLDTHGFEREILAGAVETLRDTNLLVIETYVFKLRDGAPLFDEMVKYMRDRGFQVIDMSEPLWRHKDNSLWQIDMFFVKDSRAEFSYTEYA